MSIPRTVSFSVLSVALVCAATSVRAQGTTHAPHGPPAQLRLAYIAGTHSAYTTRNVQDTQLPPGMPANAGGRTVTTGTVSIDTVSVAADGTAQQRMRIGTMDIQGPNIPAAARQAVTQGLSGMSLTYAQNSRGQIVHRDELTGVSAQLRPLMEGLLQGLDQLTPALPAEAIRVGDSWHDHRDTHINVGADMNLGVDVTYTLRELRGTARTQAAVLGVTMTMTIGGSASGPNAQVTMTGTGAATGDMTLNLGTGVLARSATHGTMTMHVAPAGASANPGQAVDIHSTFENEMRLAP